MGNRPWSGRYENSPALLVLGSGRDLSSSPCNGRLRLKVSRGFQPDFQPSASRTVSISLPNPSDKSLGYSHSVRFADEKHFRFWAKPISDATCTLLSRKDLPMKQPEGLFLTGRDDWIRTSDLTHPKRARYQAAPRPVKTFPV